MISPFASHHKEENTTPDGWVWRQQHIPLAGTTAPILYTSDMKGCQGPQRESTSQKFPAAGIISLIAWAIQLSI